MNVTEYLLSCVSEEAAEVSQCVGKCQRFGLETVFPHRQDPPYPPNKVRLIHELNDLIGVVEMLVDLGILPSNWQDQAWQAAKKQKVLDLMSPELRPYQ